MMRFWGQESERSQGTLAGGEDEVVGYGAGVHRGRPKSQDKNSAGSEEARLDGFGSAGSEFGQHCRILFGG